MAWVLGLSLENLGGHFMIELTLRGIQQCPGGMSLYDPCVTVSNIRY